MSFPLRSVRSSPVQLKGESRLLLKFKIGHLRSVCQTRPSHARIKYSEMQIKLNYIRITKKENFISLYEENKAAAVHIAEDN